MAYYCRAKWLQIFLHEEAQLRIFSEEWFMLVKQECNRISLGFWRKWKLKINV